jgi:oxaloacetate decarboxylase gamma subunit
MMTEQLIEAAVLLGVGMSVVFGFLTLLIGGIQAIAWFERKFPSPVPAIKTSNNNNNNSSTQTTVRPNQSNTQNVSNEVVAAISAALNIHRNK